jgi:hypothetical protein
MYRKKLYYKVIYNILRGPDTMDKPRFLSSTCGRILFLLLITLLAVTQIPAESEDEGSCLKFTQPQGGMEIKSASCTLSVKECATIKSVDFLAEYIPTNSSTPRIVSLGTITRPPFKLIWDISDIPNQLTRGAACYAEGTLGKKETATIKQEGVFLIHKPVDPPSYIIPYSGGRYTGTSEFVTLTSPEVSFTAKATIAWNEKALQFHIKVDNANFHSALPKGKLDKIGVTVSLDPKNRRTAYVNRDILVFTIPVASAPSRISAEPLYHPDGSFEN